MAQWLFIVGGDACGLCSGMAGIYDAKPSVPVHENCRCQVQEIPDDWDCTTEVREVQESSSTWTIVSSAGVSTCGNAGPTTADLDVSELENENVDEQFEGECGSAGGGVTPSVEIPANVEAVVSFSVTVEGTICSGDLYAVCTKTDPVAGTEYEETYLGSVGGYAERVVEGDGEVVSSTPCQ